MDSYRTANGAVLGLCVLTATERRYLEKAAKAYACPVPWVEFCQLTQSPDNPALDGGRISRRSIAHPLFLAILDMEGRLGVRQGFLKPTAGDDIESDPFADEPVSVAAAAAAKGVTRQTIYNAISDGVLVRVTQKPVQVSANSLSRWAPDSSRQRSRSSNRAPKAMARA